MNPSRASVVMFTKRLLQLLLVCGAALFLIKGMLALTAAQSTQTSGEDRKFTTKEFVDMPVRVHEVRNLQSETWPNDLEIEVENVSSKPIYFINAVLAFPDEPAPNGTSGIVLKYGKLENMDVGKYAKPEDEHLDPGKTLILRVSKIYIKGLLAKEKKNPSNLKRFKLSFNIISFGDGTGYEAGQFLDLKEEKFIS